MKFYRAVLLLILACNCAFAFDIQDVYNLYLQKEYKKAVQIIEKMESSGEKSAALSLLKFEIYKKTNQMPKAKKALFDAVKYDKGCFEAYIALSAIAIEEDDLENAKLYFESALEINPEIIEQDDVLYYYAQICILNNDFDLALENILKAIEINDNEKLYYFELAKIYLYQNKILKAVNAFEYTLGEDENLNGQCYNYLGVANLKRGNYKTALENFKKAVEISPKIIYLNNLAICYKALNDDVNYKKTIELLNAKTPDDPRDFLELSQVLYERKDFIKAKEILNEGLKRYPNSTLLQKAFDKLNKS